MGALWLLLGLSLLLFRWMVQKKLDQYKLDQYKLEDCQSQERYDKKNLTK